ncbi:MAG: hypothetical protein OEN56_06150 [Gemmatimonadota bacterium]|nr:hypothetical protein [Gemmatimonadota bacterium]
MTSIARRIPDLSTSSRLALAAIAAACAIGVAPHDVRAQDGCVFGDRGNDVVNSQTLPGIGRVTYITRPHFDCDGGVQIFADSAVAYSDRGMSHLIGSVRYVEADRELRSDEARYFSNEGRLQAEGNVTLVDEAQGSSIENGDLVYLLQTDFRDEATITVTTGRDGVRPTAVLTPPERTEPDSTAFEGRAEPDSLLQRAAIVPGDEAADSASRPPATPYTVIGDRIFLRGSGYFTATGDVEIVRDSLFAYADSAEFDETVGSLALVGSARVEGQAYQLTGRTIRMEDPGAANSDIRALRDARLTATDVLLTAAQILVRLRDDAMERLVATPIAVASDEAADSVDTETPVAVVEDFRLAADSLEVFAPRERLQRVFASGDARSVSTSSDSLNAAVLPEIARNDWLEGDTVIIRFTGAPEEPSAAEMAASQRVADSLAAAAGDSIPGEAVVLDTISEVAPMDSVRGAAAADSILDVADEGVPQALSSPDEDPSVEEIIARVRARSLYRLAPGDSTFRAGRDAPAVHYVQGSEIRIRLADGEVRSMQVAGQTRGVHLEPLRSGSAADSIDASADTLAVDTLAVDTMAVDTLAADTTVAAADTTSTPAAVSGIPPRRRLPTDSNKPQIITAPIRAPEENPWIRR